MRSSGWKITAKAITAESTIICVVGKLDANTAPELENIISKEIEDTKKIILDMKDMPYISSAGLRVLLSTQKKMQKTGAIFNIYAYICITNLF